MAFFINLFSIASRVGGSKEKIFKKFYTPLKLKKRKNFSFKIPKTPLDYDSPFFDFSHLCY